MAANLEDITAWLSDGKIREKELKRNITHMIVVCDTFDYDDYPVYVSSLENVREVFNEYDGKNMQQVMEVYSYRRDLNEQLRQGRAFCFD